ncbi:MAG: KH domain-containing protein [Acidimicrobiales bacterium]
MSDQELDHDDDVDDEVDANTIDDDLLDDEDDDDIDGNAIDADPNTIPASHARSVLEYLVRAVVDDPDSVAVEVDEGGRRTTLNVTVGEGDMGRVIGKRGRVATSIRTVTRAAAVRDGIEVDIEFLD